MDINNQINEIFESTKGMHKAEPSPFLFDQVINKINRGVKPASYSYNGNQFLRWTLAFSISFIVSINIIAVVSVNYKKVSVAKAEVTVKNDLYNAITYNY